MVMENQNQRLFISINSSKQLVQSTPSLNAMQKHPGVREGNPLEPQTTADDLSAVDNAEGL